MKKYDFIKAHYFIAKLANEIESVSLGMREDWFWTAQTVYEDNKFTMNLRIKDKMGGIKGSTWATPSMQVCFKDGREVMVDCYVGQSTKTLEECRWSFGCLSGSCQDNIDALPVTGV
jgi:hypothetical protein